MSAPSLPADVRRALAEHWTEVALLEHASIASFSVFALELLSVGAPPSLVEGANRAALDEIEHAKLAFRLASRYAGEPLSPGPLPVADVGARLGGGLVELATSTAREGCVGETVGAVEARAAIERATDDEVRRVLAIVERDESNHAELGWQTVRWAIDRGGRPVHDAVRTALEHELESPLGPAPPRAADTGLLAAHGVLPPAELVEIRRRALRDVVRPAMVALLGVG
jgi:hypothetical protein